MRMLHPNRITLVERLLIADYSKGEGQLLIIIHEMAMSIVQITLGHEVVLLSGSCLQCCCTSSKSLKVA